MSRSDRYFQFPLSALAFGADDTVRLQHIVAHSVLTRGWRLGLKLDVEVLKKSFTSMPPEARPMDMDCADKDHLFMVVGMRDLCVPSGSVARMVRMALHLEGFCLSFQENYGSSPNVRLRADLYGDALSGKMSYREFSILCGVYSVIGEKENPVRITRDHIIARSLGYKTPTIMTPEALASRKDKKMPPTVDQLRYTLKELEARSLFVRVQASRRKVFFSNRITRARMEALLLGSQTRHAVKLRDNRAADRNLMQKIKAIKTGKPVERGDDLSSEVGDSPRNPRSAPTSSPHGSPHQSPPSPHYNTTSGRESGRRESRKKEAEEAAERRASSSFSRKEEEEEAAVHPRSPTRNTADGAGAHRSAAPASDELPIPKRRRPDPPPEEADRFAECQLDTAPPPDTRHRGRPGPDGYYDDDVTERATKRQKCHPYLDASDIPAAEQKAQREEEQKKRDYARMSW